MRKFTAGRFSADVSAPYPVSIVVDDGSGHGLTLQHRELRDLQHVIERAMAHARRQLHQYGEEVE